MSSKLISLIVVIVIVVGGFLLFKSKSVAPTEAELELGMPVIGSDVEEMIVEEEAAETSLANIKEFMVDATTFSFSPSTMTVNKGDTVKVTVKNVKGVHDLKIDEFNAATRILQAGEERTITFVADKVGNFEYYCSVGNHRAMGMVGTLTVK